MSGNLNQMTNSKKMMEMYTTHNVLPKYYKNMGHPDFETWNGGSSSIDSKLGLRNKRNLIQNSSNKRRLSNLNTDQSNMNIS